VTDGRRTPADVSLLRRLAVTGWVLWAVAVVAAVISWTWGSPRQQTVTGLVLVGLIVVTGAVRNIVAARIDRRIAQGQPDIDRQPDTDRGPDPE
jgi:type VI protein secretion system component VasK